MQAVLVKKTREAVIHFLFECLPHNFVRHDLDGKLRHFSRDLKYILSDVDHTCNLLLRYIKKTRCFKDLGDVVLSKIHV